MARRSRARLASSAISSGSTSVPVGFDGLATIATRVRAVQDSRARAGVSW